MKSAEREPNGSRLFVDQSNSSRAIARPAVWVRPTYGASVRASCLASSPTRRAERWTPTDTAFGKRDSKPGGAARIDEFVALEEGRHERHWVFEELLLAFDFTLSFVSGEQDAAAGLKGPMELSQHGAKLRVSNVDQRVERDQPAESLGREG
jgi:hypothetical protein